jgi:hypothetical protein
VESVVTAASSPEGAPLDDAPTVHDDAPRHDGWKVVAIGAVLAIPLVIAVGVLHSPRWYPLLDWAQTEIRVRDVWSSHPPLIGLAGRIGPYGEHGGSHPGPLSFFGLWPTWTLLGRSAYGLQVGDAVFDVVNIALALWIGYRRGGLRMALAIGATMAILMRAYGAFMLTSPWNPYMPALWWFVFVLAVWSVCVDDLAMLPVAVLTGSFCLQTHISYLGLVGGLGAFGLVVIGVRAYQRRTDAAARRRFFRYFLWSVLLLAVLWAPPVVDQIRHSPGNLATIRDYFAHPPPPDKPIGLRQGANSLLTQLNPFRLFGTTLVRDGHQRAVEGTRLPGVALLLLWAGSVAVASRSRARKLLWLDAVLAVALATGLFSASRIVGDIWFYLFLWAWAIVALLLFTIGWAAAEFARPRVHDPQKWAQRGTVALAGVIAIATVFFAIDAARVTVMSPRLNKQMSELIPPTIARLDTMRQQGARGPYRVTWLPDVQGIGAQGYSLLDEMLRHGFDARADVPNTPGATQYHVLNNGAHPNLQVHLATGADIANYQRDSRFTQIAYSDPRTDAERAQFNQLHDQVVASLRQSDPNDVAQIDNNLFMLALSPNVPAATREQVSQMLDLTEPAAIFIGPADVDIP